MSTSFNIHDWENGLNAQFDSFDPDLPDEVWNNIDSQLDFLNSDIQFDDQIRNDFNQASMPVPPEVWAGVQQGIGTAPGFFASHWGKIAIGTGIIAALTFYTLSDSYSEKNSFISETGATKEINNEVPPAGKNEQDKSESAVPVSSEPRISTSGSEAAPSYPKENNPAPNPKNPSTLASVPFVKDPEPETVSGSPGTSGANGAGLGTISTGRTFDFGGTDTNVCIGQTIGFNVKGIEFGRAEILINGKLKQTYAPADQIRYKLEEAGVYLLELRLQQKDGLKTYFKKVTVNALPVPEFAQSELPDGEFVFQTEVLSGTKVIWYIDYDIAGGKTRINKRFYDERPSEHRVVCVATNGQGCKDSVVKTVTNTYLVTIREPHIPDVFTPNGDGTNDTWQISIEGYTYFELVVYNPKLEIVFSTKDPKILWNGINRNTGEMCQDGSYVYKLNYSLGGGKLKPLSGRVEIFTK